MYCGMKMLKIPLLYLSYYVEFFFHFFLFDPRLFDSGCVVKELIYYRMFKMKNISV